MSKSELKVARFARSGFTLIEVTIVCVLLAMIASIAAISLSGRVSAANRRNAIERIEAADRLARQLARTTGLPSTLKFDEADNEIHVLVNRRVQRTFRLSDGIVIESVRQQRSRSRDVQVSPLGQSLTYAVAVSQRKDQQAQWVVVAGVSGHTMRTENAEQADALLRF